MADGVNRDPFAPLPAADSSGAERDTWAPILPAPHPLPEAMRHRRHGTPAATWHYRDAAGALLFAVCRFDPPGARKEILPLSCGAEGWRWKAPPEPRPLYGLDRLAARPAAPVLVVEGEKAADAAVGIFPDFAVVTWPGGAQAVGKADWTPLRERLVAAWPDNDAPGHKAAAEVAKAASAAGAARAVVVPVPRDWPGGWDVADPLPAGASADVLRAMLAQAMAAGPAPAEAPGDALEIARLAALEPLAYDRERQAAADRLNVRVATLDSEVEKARPKPAASETATGTGRSVTLPEAEPWPEPVGLAALLRDLAATISRHVILTPAAADAIALWIAHTWVYDRFEHTPRLSVTSPARRCGKSTLLEVLRATCRRPLKADNISASGVFRTVEALRPLTLLVDEADSFLGDNEELRGILNSGFERSGKVVRVVDVKEEWQSIHFATYCPVALAGIGKLPGTLEDRAVPVVLARKTAAETVVKLRTPGARAGLHALARRLARWAADRGRHLPADPAVPEAMGDREGDIAVPLLAIADDAGGDWPARGRKALLAVFGQRTAVEGNAEAGALLLADLRANFLSLSAEQMTTEDIVARLGAMEDRPWPEWRAGRPMTKTQLARALAPFGIRPGTIRVGRGGGDTAKGYHREAFEEAWGRYLPLDTPPSAQAGGFDPSHRHKPASSRAAADNRSVTVEPDVTGRKSPKAAENLGCDGVTDRCPPDRPAEGGEGADVAWSEAL